MIIVNALFLILVSFISLYLTSFISNKFNLYDYPDKKKIHLTKTPNIAGIAIMCTTLTSFLIYDYSFDNILIFLLSLIIIVIGFIDDLKNIKALIKLILISIPVACFVYKVCDISSLGSYFGYHLSLGKFSFFFTFMCMLLLINATNYMDGLDGLLSLLAILSFLFILILILKYLPYFSSFINLKSDF